MAAPKIAFLSNFDRFFVIRTVPIYVAIAVRVNAQSIGLGCEPLSLHDHGAKHGFIPDPHTIGLDI